MSENPTKWMDRIACAGVDTDDFINDVATIGRARDFARQYCAICPVHQECLRFGVRTESEGVFGGYLLRPNYPYRHKVRLL